ncbi:MULTISPECIES: hypothetical protein [unclassified Roseateles]|uniref:hypothetical protein n=1 Tax=unclassified Roseateles TaxID=2626991 RepID=UPI0006F7898F|nr:MULTISPECIES: hypothetical protein [unclassified Roseateles]KQW43331.1 hypothetical protein ASC81_16190 [Pelomonas sp. Root405]KRA71069.1 hypothetical protein ASD88_14715 [Pelomonas sp. Root662]
MLRTLTAGLVATTALLGATAAQAETHWSIGINLPATGIVVGNAPRYHVHQPAPVYYRPAPVVRYAPPQVVYETSYRDRRWDNRGWDRDHRDHHDRHERHERRENRWHDRHDDHGPRR